MKSAKAIILAIAFSLVIGVLGNSTYAQEIIIPTGEITPSPTAVPTIINYELPYPGLLPGSPLYRLKALRDKILEILISDSLKKSNYYLLQADKRLASSISLFSMQRDTLAETTLSKGQNYLEKSLDNVVSAKNSQKNISDILAKLRMSSAKQREQISLLEKNAKGEIKKKLLNDLERAEKLEKRAEEIKP